MIDVKIEGKVGTDAAAGLEPHARSLYDNEGCRVLAIVELVDTERNVPAPGRDKTASVKLQIISLEIPTAEQENVIREAQRALYLERTADGTLDESGAISLYEGTLDNIGAILHDHEVARLRTGLNHWARHARHVNAAHYSHTELLREMKVISEGLADVVARAPLFDALEED